MRYGSLLAAVLVSLMAAGSTPSARAAGQSGVSRAQAQATLQDFGYQAMKVNGRLAQGSRPLLVLIATFPQWNPIAHSAVYYDSLIFNPSISRSVNGYLGEVSLNRFSWARTPYGVVGPVAFTQAEGDSNILDRTSAISYVFSEIVRRRSLDLSIFDADGDGTIRADELGVLVLHNQGNALGGKTMGINVPVPNSTLIATLLATEVGGSAAFMTFCHELTHQLGAFDLYSGKSCKNGNLTLMSCTIVPGADYMATYHLDPWHKMQLGWVEPRIRSLWLGGIENLPAQQLEYSSGPLILYDPQRGTDEFFIVEHRAAIANWVQGYDFNVSGDGMAIWHVKQDANHKPILLNDSTYAVNAEGSPTLVLGGNTPWPSNSTTPLLTWIGGTPSKTHLVVHPFETNDAFITVEWLTDDEAWADFNYAGWIELGTFDFPYKTLSGALAGTPRGGRLHIKASTTAEIATSDKPMRIDTYGGSARMGQ